MADPIWILCIPDCGLEEFDTLTEARDAFDRAVDHLRDEASDGWSEDVESLRLFRCEVVAQLRLRTVATAEDDTEDGERCRDAGWGYFAEGVVEETEPEVEALRAELRDRDAHIERLRLELACERGEPGPWVDAGWLQPMSRNRSRLELWTVDGGPAAGASGSRWWAGLTRGECCGVLDGIERAHRALGLPIPWVSP
jgi:hypothetical protein